VKQMCGCAATSTSLISFLNVPFSHVINILYISTPHHSPIWIWHSTEDCKYQNIVDPWSVRRNSINNFRLGTWTRKIRNLKIN
jgi:hypothetical protein